VKQVSAIAGLAATTLVLGAAVAGCASNKSPGPSSTMSSSAPTSSAPPPSGSGAAQPSDYSNLLIKPTDIVVPGDSFTLAQTLPVPTPAGIEGVFMNQSGSRKIDDTIYVYAFPATAGQALDANAKMLSDPDLGVQGTPASVDVGTGGRMVVGTSPDGSKAKAVVMFTEGRALAVVELDSPPNDPVQPDFVTDIAKKQDAAIKSGLPA